ncbi:MAG: pilus assembly protein PilM [Lachnospiraceae bacterium]|nr:pilus assembly protein PilM [Lachnospiraceae bacterium]
MASNSKVLTIDITNESVTIIEVTASAKKGTTVHNAVIFETPEGSYEDGFVRNKEALAVAIKDQLVSNGISNKNAIFVLTSTKIVNREVVIPKVKPGKVAGIIAGNASDYFPVNIEDYVVSHSILESATTDGQMRVLVVAAPQLMVRGYYELADAAGLKVQALDYIGNAMLQLIKTQISANSTTMVIQLGGESSILNIVKGDTLLLQRTVPYGTNAVVQEVMDERNVDAATAMTLLQNERLITVDFDDNNATGAFRYLMNNIGRVMDFYASKNPDKPIDDVYLTGDGALIRGIEGLFKIQLNISTKIMDSLYNVKFDPTINMQIYNPVYLIASIGAAFDPMNFKMAGEKGKKSSAGGASASDAIGSGTTTRILAIVLVLVAIAAIGGWVVTGMMKTNAEREKASLESQIAAIQDIENIISEYDATTAKVQDIRALYESTVTPNEQALTFVEALEDKIPKDVVLTDLSLTADGNSFNCEAESYDSIAKFIMQLKTISCVKDVYTSGITVEKAEDKDESEKYTFSITCSYSSGQSTDEVVQ